MARNKRSRRFVGRFDEKVEEALEEMFKDEQVEIEEAQQVFNAIAADFGYMYPYGNTDPDWANQDIDQAIFGFIENDDEIYLTPWEEAELADREPDLFDCINLIWD